MEAAIQSFLMESNIIIPILFLCVSLYTLGKGADILVDNAVILSLRWGVPKMILGATLISLGTTLPEASVSVMAAVRGNADLALGNAMGSIIADTGLILGLAALLGTVPVDRSLVKRQGSWQLGAAVLLALVSLPFFSSGSEGLIYQWIGWIFVALLCLYMYLSFKWSKNSKLEKSEEDSDDEENDKSPFVLVLLVVLGIAIIVISSKVLIPSVGVVASRVGIPQSIIAATLVAFGTSLPELVTAITAVKKGHGELAAGNVIGADILNALFVLGAAASVTPAGITVPVYFFYLQIPTMLTILFVFRFLSTRKSAVVGRFGGGILLGLYIVYLVLNFALKGVIS